MTVAVDARPRPTLLLLPDGESRVDLARPLLGRRIADRLTDAALEAGFGAVMLAPGTRAEPAGASPRATGEPVGAPTLVVYESACIHPELLRLMVVHPLEPDERFTVYDGVGRPTALFAGTLEAVPEAMPISEELALPEELGEGSVARYVYAEDRARLEALVLRGEGIFDPEASLWHRHVSLPALRLLADSGRPPAQCELLALVLAVGAGALALVHSWPTLVLAALSLLAGVQIALVTPALRRLRAPSSSEAADAPALVPEALVRPFGHAALTASLTYLLVAQTGRSSVAGLVLLAVGGAAVLLSLGQARSLLRREATVPLELPSSAGLAARLGLRVPSRYRVPLTIELTAFVLALTGAPTLPWAVLVAVGLARLWRWFAGPVRAHRSTSDP